jgi:effector-binding domain-containing protein
VDLEPTPTAVVRAEMTSDEVPRRIISLYDAVYAALPSSSATQDGQNIAVYAAQGDGRVAVEIGVQVSAPFTGSVDLVSSSLPSGPALHHRHVGAYDTIGMSYDEMYAWVAKHGVATTGVSMEIYGDHDPDPSRLVTDLYVMLAD